MVKGVVDRVSEKDGKFGKMFSVKLRETDTWYGLKSARPQFKEGQLIEFEAHQNARGYWDADGRSVRILSDAVVEAPRAAYVAGSQPMSKDDFWRRKEDRDLVNDQLRNIGAARNTAIEFVDLLAKYEAVKLPAKQADKEKALLDAVEHYRKEFMAEIKEEPAEELDENVPYEAAPEKANSEWN